MYLTRIIYLGGKFCGVTRGVLAGHIVTLTTYPVCLTSVTILHPPSNIMGEGGRGLLTYRLILNFTAFRCIALSFLCYLPSLISMGRILDVLQCNIKRYKSLAF